VRNYDDFRNARRIRQAKAPHDTRNAVIWILLTFGLVALYAASLASAAGVSR
jgi:hypothetical protein